VEGAPGHRGIMRAAMNKFTIEERTQAIRRACPDVLAELFEMQNRLCDLCGQPIQDLVCAALDHSIPVIRFARGPLPIEEAIRQANAPENLRAAHTECNNVKHDKARAEWFARGLNDRAAPRYLDAVELEILRQRATECGRIVKENGLGIHAPGMQAKGGRIMGRIAKEKGLGIFAPGFDLAAAGRKGARIVGRITKDKRIGIHAPGMAAKGGHIGGRVSGRICKDKAIGIFAPGMAAKAGRKGAILVWQDSVHREMMRWHRTPWSAWKKKAA